MLNVRFTDNPGQFQLPSNPPVIPLVVLNLVNNHWLSNRDLIALDAILGKPPYEYLPENDQFFVFDAIYQRRTNLEEAKNPLLLQSVPGFGPAVYILGLLAKWRSCAYPLPGSIYTSVLDNWQSGFGQQNLQAEVTAALTRLDISQLLAPADRDDLKVWVVMNALIQLGTGGTVNVTYVQNGPNGPQNVTVGLNGLTGKTTQYDIPSSDSPIFAGIFRMKAVNAARTLLQGLGLPW